MTKWGSLRKSSLKEGESMCTGQLVGEGSRLCCCCVTQSCLTLCNPMDAARQASLSSTKSQSLGKVMSIKSLMPFNHLVLFCPLLLLPSTFPSIRVFFSELAHRIRFGQSIRASASVLNEYKWLISFRIDWLDLLAFQRTLKSLLQHHSSKTSILWHSAFVTVQLLHPYMTTGKTIALNIWTFVAK